MDKRHGRVRSRRSMRRILWVQTVCLLAALAACLCFSARLRVWQGMVEAGGPTPDGILAAASIVVCVVNLGIFIKAVFRTVVELEDAVRVLQGYGDEDSLRNKSPAELLQVLLQREAAAQIMSKQAEINALQNQINPHFLYNTLETIRGQALCCGADEIADTTKDLADIFRYNISRKGTMVHLREELANISAYMKIQRIRFSDKFELTADVDPDTLELQIPKLLVQPVIENALKHGLEMKRGKGHIHVRAFRTEHRLEISVEDDGVGMPPEMLAALNEKLSHRGDGSIAAISGAGTDIGLVNINDRIRLIYGEEYGVTAISAEHMGTKVTLSLGIVQE